MRSRNLELLAQLALLAAMGACGGRASSLERSAAPGTGDVPTLEEQSEPAEPADVPGVEPGASPLAESPCSATGVWPGSVRAARQDALEPLRGCERIAGDLIIELFEGLDPAPLQSVRVVDGWVDVFGGSLASPGAVIARPLDMLRSLERAGGLRLSGVQAPNLDALDRLQTLTWASQSTVMPPWQFALWIEECPGLTSLTGLKSLASVGQIHLRDNRDLVSLRGLESLQEVDSLGLYNSPVPDLEGFNASSLRVLRISGTLLESLAGLGSATQLEQLVLGPNPALSSLEGAAFGELLAEIELDDNPALASLSALANRRKLTSLAIFGSPSLRSLTGLEQLEEIGSLHLQGLGLQDLTGLAGLVTAQQISLVSNPWLAELTGLSSLREVSSLLVEDSPAFARATGIGTANVQQLNLISVALTELTGLEQLRIAGTFELNTALSLGSLSGLPRLGDDATLALIQLPALSDTTALAGQRSLAELALLSTGLGVLSGLADLERLRGLHVTDNPSLTEIEASPRLRELRFVQMDQNRLLRSLPAWDQLANTLCTDCDQLSLRIWSNAALETGPQVPALQQAGSIFIGNNPSLRELLGLSALRSVESLRVVNNPILASVALPALEEAGGVDIHGNSALDESQLFPLREQLGNTAALQLLSNSSGPALLDPCPWTYDGSCDESSGACAPNTDAPDCLR